MRIYNYNPFTFEFTTDAEADLNPAATKIEGHDVYMLPANATYDEPPKTNKNQVAVFENNGWQIKSDFRGMYQVNSDMIPSKITEIGDVPEGYAVATEAQAQKIVEDDLYYIVDNGELIVNPNYEAEKAAREQDRINKLKMTALDFIGVLVAFGLTLEQINDYLESNLEIKMQLTYCQNVYCGVVKALMPITLEGITITADMVEQAFILKGN